MALRCFLGCKGAPDQSLHIVPTNSKRRAEWARILGVYPETKRAFLCKSHFSDYYINGGRISKFALPKTPDSRTLNNLNVARENRKQRNAVEKAVANLVQEDSSESTVSAFSDNDSCTTFPETEICFPDKEICKSENKIKANNLLEDPLLGYSNVAFSSKNRNGTAKSQDIFANVEDFKICKDGNKDVIIKGRYVQTNDYLIVSYTPPKKWTLQEQVKIINENLTRQLKRLNVLIKENRRLSMQLKKHDKILPTLRFLQMNNRYLCAQIKMYKMHKAIRRNRVIKNRLKSKKSAAVTENNVNII